MPRETAIDLIPTTSPPSFAAKVASEMVQLPDGRRMHLSCAGQGEPVVLLDYGAGGTAKRDWADLATRIAAAANTRVCAYDRPGTILDADHLSRSDPAPMSSNPSFATKAIWPKPPS